MGVKRQYCGALGKTGNCQVGVSTALIGPTLVWPTSCELYLPAEWASDPDRRDRARVPTTVRFREKWRIGLAHIRTILKAGFAIEAVVTAAAFIFLQWERHRSAEAPRPTLPAVRAWLGEIVALQYLVGNRQLFNLALSLQRNPPLRR